MECHLKEMSLELGLICCGEENQDEHGLAVFANFQFVTSKLKGVQPEQI